LGHQVIEANSATEALDLFRARADIDLLITDQAMPAMTGSDLIAAIRAERPDLPVVLATGYGETPSDGNVAVHRLGKPFGQIELRRAIVTATR
jgi:CheY-like chemotaxis protein